ncbi:MAG: AAA family ATPase [Sporolactobacillus sp.]
MTDDQETYRLIDDLIQNVETVIAGKHEIIKWMTVALLAGGHVLIEDIPGVGKTMLVRAIAQSIGASFKRIQFTPDLMPSDITGLSIYNPKNGTFEFRPGPLMSHIVLADEINRASSKTQSALLEGMAENQVTTDGVTRNLPELFFVMATQNPIEYEGTYNLPEAQLDRFLMKLSLGYPTRADEKLILDRLTEKDPLESLKAVLTIDDVIQLRAKASTVYISDAIKNYLLDLVTATRNHPLIELGVSPRGTIGLYKAVQAFALADHRQFALPDDVQKVAPRVLAHRLVMNEDRPYGSQTAGEQIIYEILSGLEVPVPQRESMR